MEYALIAGAALFASFLTFFSGFGLGTLLLPVFILFFPIPIAIALTAIVHLLNNLFKLVLVWKKWDSGVLLRFGLPALIAAYLGSKLLIWFAIQPAMLNFELFGEVFTTTPLKVMIGSLMIFFSFFETSFLADRISIAPRFLPLGGMLSGFLGGVSGHQGALRSLFLLKSGLDKEAFIATGVSIACLVDVARITIYSSSIPNLITAQRAPYLIVAISFAFLGAFLGRRFLTKVKMKFVRFIVTLMLFAIGIALITGVI